jgi:hypothetical protein
LRISQGVDEAPPKLLADDVARKFQSTRTRPMAAALPGAGSDEEEGDAEEDAEAEVLAAPVTEQVRERFHLAPGTK